MAAETQYTANTGMVTLTTGNTSLTGGTIGTNIWSVITGASNGTLIKTVRIKSQATISAQGMIRFFIYDGTNQKLISEIAISVITQTSEDPSLEITVPLDYSLKSGWQLLATTHNTETGINVFAEGLNWAYYASAVRPESSNYTANTGMATISTANNKLDGTGTISDVITAASNGTLIQSVTIKAQGSPSFGMVRLFISDGTNTKLLTEMPVTATTQSATATSFSARTDFGGRGFALKSGWKLRASTEVGNSFNVIAEGDDWTYPV